MKQPQMIQPKSFATSPTTGKGPATTSRSDLPKRNHCYERYATLSNHVIWHCKFLDDPDHFVPETFCVEPGRRF